MHKKEVKPLPELLGAFKVLLGNNPCCGPNGCGPQPTNDAPPTDKDTKTHGTGKEQSDNR